MFAVMKKELKSYFFSPIGYVVIGIFLLCFSVFNSIILWKCRFKYVILLYSIIWLNNNSTNINNENIFRRKKKWNRAIAFNVSYRNV